MTKQRINMDIDRVLWKKVSIRCIELEIEKREFVEAALVEYLERGKGVPRIRERGWRIEEKAGNLI